MLSEDYLLRIIRQTTSVFARILGLKKEGQFEQANQVIENVLEQLLGMDAHVIDLMDDESLYNVLTQNDVLDLQRLEYIAALFKEKGDIQSEQKLQTASQSSYLRALNYSLVVAINSEPAKTGSLGHRINELLEKIVPASFEDQTLLNLYTYFETLQEYARADAMLDQLVERKQNAPYLLEEKKAFYTRLLEKSTEDLTKGGMEREQIEQKLSDLP